MLFIAATLALVTQASAADTQPTAAMMAPLKILLRAANGDSSADVSKICSKDAVIMDEPPPHRWDGETAAVDWLASLKVQFKDQQVTGARAEFHTVSVYEHSADRAWIVIPTTWTGAQGGRRFEEDGVWSFLVVQSGDAWKISADSWSVTDLKYL